MSRDDDSQFDAISATIPYAICKYYQFLIIGIMMDCFKDSPISLQTLPDTFSSSPDIDNVECLIKSLYIEKNNRNNSKQSKSGQAKNPFKRKQ